jgi:hypothetical protein
MTSNLTPIVAQEHIAELQRTAQRERYIRRARARMSGSLRPRITVVSPFRALQRA